MRVREVFITKSNNVSDLSELKQHSNVKGFWILPKEFVLFEFYHPAYELMNESDPEIVKKVLQNPSSKQQMLEIDQIRRSVLSPLYEKIKDFSDQLMLFVPAGTTNYFFLGHKKDRIKWPDITGFVWSKKNWAVANSVELQIKLKKTKPEFLKKLDGVIDGWQASGIQNGRISEMKRRSFESSQVKLKCDFRNGCGDPIMTLCMLLTDAQKTTTVYSLELIEEGVGL